MPEKTIDQRYRLVRSLGRGGFGEVFLATDTEEGGEVAVKLIDRGSSDLAQLKRRLQREARATQALDPMRVARVDRVGESEDGQLYLVMPYVAGDTLRAIVRRGGLGAEEVLRIVSELGTTLDAAHAHGLVHRDVKPDNVIVSPDGRVVLLDFGIVKAVVDESDGSAYASTQLTRTGSTVGTVAYASPEQALGGWVDARADQFALGVVAFELFTGKLPWQGDIPARVLAQVLYEESPPASSLLSTLSSAIDLTLQRAMAKNPGARFASIRAFADALENAVLRGIAPQAPSIPATTTGNRAFVARTADGDTAVRRPGGALRRATLALLAVVAIGGIGATVLEVRHRPATGWWAGARATLAVPRALGDPHAACPEWLLGALSEGLTSQLAAGGRVRAVGPRELGALADAPASAVPGDPTTKALRGAFGADAVVVASCARGDGDKSDAADVRVRVVSTSNPPRELASFGVSGSGDAPSNLVSRIAEKLRRDLGVEPPDAVELARAERTLPASSEVSRAYVEGLTKLEAFDGVGARDALRKVVAREPHFAPGHAALAAACAYLGEQREAASEGTLAVADAASLPNEERLLVSADAAAARYSWDEALETYRAIVRVFPDRRDVALKLVRTSIDAGRPKDARAALEELQERTGGDSSDPRVFLDAAMVARLVGDRGAGAEAARKAEALADAVGLPYVKAQALLVECQGLGGVVAGDARDPCEEAQKLFDAVGDRMGVMRAEGIRIYVLVQRGDFERAQALTDHSRVIADELGSPDARSGAEMETTLIAMGQGKVNVWKKSGRESVVQADLGGNAGSQVRARINFAGGLVDEGDLDEGRTLFEEGLKIARDAGMKSSAAIILQNLVNYYLPKGEITHALAGATEALSMLPETSFDRAWALDALGNAEVEADSLSSARDHFEQARALRESAHVAASASLQNLGEALLDLGDLDGALRDTTGAVDDFTEAGVPIGASAASGVLARVYLARGEIAKAMTVLDSATALARDAKSNVDAYVPVRMRALLLAGKPAQALAAGLPLPEEALAQRYTRLVRGEILMRQGAREKARGELEALEKEARAAGHLRVEHLAEAVLAGKNPAL